MKKDRWNKQPIGKLYPNMKNTKLSRNVLMLNEPEQSLIKQIEDISISKDQDMLFKPLKDENSIILQDPENCSDEQNKPSRGNKFQNIQKKVQNQMNQKLKAVAGWNACTKIERGLQPNNVSFKKIGAKIGSVDAMELFLRNQEWKKEKERKIFEKARKQFRKQQYFCYFRPKLL